MRVTKRIQAAGNSGLCGDITNDTIHDTKTNRTWKRSEGILSYIQNKNGVTKKAYTEGISEYLARNYGIKENDSYKQHWVNRPLWWSFVEFAPTGEYRTTPVGRQYRNILKSNDPDKREQLSMLLLEQGTRIQYPNLGTPRVDPSVRVRPIALIFYLFLKYKSLTYDELTCTLPYITDASYLDDNNDLDFKNLGKLGERYVKLLSWDITDFIKLGLILVDKTGDEVTYKLNPKYVADVKYYYGKYTAMDLFLPSAEGVRAYVLNDKDNSRDGKLSKTVKRRDDYTDVFTGVPASWHSASDGEFGCRMHHIIPIEKKDYYIKNYGVNTDSEEYCITVRCETHNRIHESLFEEKRDLVIAMFNWLSDEAKAKIDLTLDKLFDLYK